MIDGHRFRVIKLMLESGEEEVLITNLGRNAFLYHEFQELYHLRWAIETKYNTLKNKLEIETFSGKTVNSIMQDFYATVYLANMISAIKLETDQIIAEKIRDQKLVGATYKHEYKTNENVLIGSLKHVFIVAVLNDEVKIRRKWLYNLMNKVSKYKSSSPPNRHFERPVSSHKKVTEKLKKAL